MSLLSRGARARSPLDELRSLARQRGPLWLAAQLLLSLAVLWLIWWALSGFAAWALGRAEWAVVADNLRLFSLGRYPAEEAWRPSLLLVIVSALTGLEAGRAGRKAAARLLIFVFAFLLVGPALAPAIEAASPSLSGLFASFEAGRALLLIAGLGIGLGWLAGLRLSAWVGGSEPRARRVSRIALWAYASLAILALAILAGIPGYLPPVGPTDWGGLLLTLMLAAVSIGLSFPLGVLFALGRRSSLPLVRLVSIAYIELIRGVPLVTVLYMASLLLPLLLPEGLTPSNVAKAMAGLTAFAAAYVAEDVRGGLASVSQGQVEAAKAMGLGAWQVQRLVVLPQAIRAVIPAIAGQFISLFKDTALVMIIGLRELLGIAMSAANQPEHIGRFREALVFIAIIYFIFSAVLSRASRRLERLGEARD